MENLEFILGALSMIGLFGLGYAVMGVFKVTKRSDGFDEAINGIFHDLEDKYKELHLRIDGEIDRVDKLHDDNVRYTDQLSQELYRYIDSRFDKFENRLKKIDKDGCEPVKKSKQLLTD
jgi:hypothetical protein